MVSYSTRPQKGVGSGISRAGVALQVFGGVLQPNLRRSLYVQLIVEVKWLQLVGGVYDPTYIEMLQKRHGTFLCHIQELSTR